MREIGKKYIGGSRASRNRLALLSLVDTPYFIFLDGDDYWTDEKKLDIQYNILENPGNADCIGCGHRIAVINDDKPNVINYYLPGNGSEEKKYRLDEYWNDFYCHTDTILFRSNVIDRFDSGLLADDFNDNMITFCFMQYGKLYYIPKDLAVYRLNDNGIWAAENEAVNVVRNIFDYDIELQINPAIKKEIENRHISDFICVMKHRKAFMNINSEYIKLAQKYKCTTMESVLKTGNLFTGNWIKDGFYILLIRVRKYIEHRLKK